MFCSVVLVGRLHGEQSCCEEVINRSSFRQQGQSARQNDYMWAGMPIAKASGTHTHTQKPTHTPFTEKLTDNVESTFLLDFLNMT